MKSYKMLFRQVGVQNTDLNIISEADLNEYIEYQLSSQGFVMMGQPTTVGEVKDIDGKTQGFKVVAWFEKDNAPVPAVAKTPKKAKK